MTYDVEEPFLAVRDEPARPFVFVTITEGSIITIIGEVQQSGLVDVRYDGEIVTAFMRERRSNAESLKKAIVDTNDDITPRYAIITVVTRDNKQISGLERWLDNFSARLVDESGNERTFLRDEVTSVTREMRSTMPDNYGKIFNEAELNDLVAYIVKTRSEANSQ